MIAKSEQKAKTVFVENNMGCAAEGDTLCFLLFPPVLDGSSFLILYSTLIEFKNLVCQFNLKLTKENKR